MSYLGQDMLQLQRSNHFKSKCKNIHALNQSNNDGEDSGDQ